MVTWYLNVARYQRLSIWCVECKSTTVEGSPYTVRKSEKQRIVEMSQGDLGGESTQLKCTEYLLQRIVHVCPFCFKYSVIPSLILSFSWTFPVFMSLNIHLKMNSSNNKDKFLKKEEKVNKKDHCNVSSVLAFALRPFRQFS